MEQWEGAEEGATLGLYIATDRSNNSYEVVKQWHTPVVVAFLLPCACSLYLLLEQKLARLC